jgi:hypothetical protein
MTTHEGVDGIENVKSLDRVHGVFGSIIIEGDTF